MWENLSAFWEMACSPRTVWLILWTGMAMLSLALITLMWTRWGHDKPLSKCIALSVFAHFLLVGYAYMTNLFIDVPGQGGDGSIHVAIVDAPEGRVETPRFPDEVDPWDQFPTDSQFTPKTLSIERRTVESPTDAKQPEVARAPAIAAPRPSELVAKSPPTTTAAPVPVPRAADPAVTTPAPPAEAPQTPPTANVRPDPIAGPAVGAVPRPQPGPTAPTPAAEAGLPEIPPDLASMAGRPPRLTDIPLASPSADAVAGPIDDPVASSRHIVSSQPARPNPGSTSHTSGGAPVPGVEGHPGSVASTASPDARVSAPGPRRAAAGDELPLVYQDRVRKDRVGVAQQRGGSARTEAAVDAALAWLAANQSPDGRWNPRTLEGGRETRVHGHDRGSAGADADTGITGLAVLSFLAAGHSHLDGPFRKNVQHGLEFLLRSQGSDGNLAGPARTFARMYCHGMAALAISEAYAMTGDRRLAPHVERAMAYTVASQHPAQGGWRYQPGDLGDMSQFGWQVMALKSAELAGVAIPQRTQDGMRRFLRSASAGPNGGLASYRPGEKVTPTMTAEALACRFFLGIDREDPAVDEAANYLVLHLPDDGTPNLYYWYYAQISLHQLQDGRWRRWNGAVQDRLLASQRTDGAFAGSWDPDTVWGSYGGRVYSTALGALCLEVYYRYLPLYGPEAKEGKTGER
jgi:hypothetical protein